MRQLIRNLRRRMAGLWSFATEPLEITIEEFDTVVFIRDGKIIRSSGKSPASQEQLNHFRSAFRSMDRAFDSMEQSFKEMDEAFKHIEQTVRRK